MCNIFSWVESPSLSQANTVEGKYRNTCTCSVFVLRLTLKQKKTKVSCTKLHSGLVLRHHIICSRAASATERVKIPKSKQAVNPVLQNGNLLFAEKLQWLVKKASAGMCVM